MPRSSPLALVLLAAPASCADDVAGDANTSASAGPTTTTSASATEGAGTSGETPGTSSVPTTTAGDDTTTTTSTSSTSDATSDATTATGTDTTTTTGGTTTTGDTGSTSDTTGAGDEPVGAFAPKWLRKLDGLNSLAPPRVVPLPDGDALAIVSGGLYAKKIVLAQGDPDEETLDTMYIAPALARFDGATGALAEARMLAQYGKGTMYGMSVQTREVKLAGNGDVLVAGTWFGSAEFFPGTAHAKTMIAEIKLNGNNLDRAEEPFFYRMTPSGAVTWLIRGRTPPGIQTTWFNYGKGIAALGDDVVIAGEYELSGFVVAHGTPGAKTMSGTQGSYFARLGAGGSPTWAYRNTTRLASYPLRGGADGAIYSILPADATFFADAGAPTMTVSEPGLTTVSVGRLDPAGGLEWTANVAKDGFYPLRNLEVAESGDLLLYGEIDGKIVLRDAGGQEKSVESDVAQGFVAGLDPAGAGLYLRALGPTVSLTGPTLAGADGVWIVASIAAPYELEIAGAMTSLPALGYPADSSATALLRFDQAGTVTAAQVVGVDLYIDSLAWSGPEQASFFVTGAYWCETAEPFVVSEDGDGLVALPAGCEMMPLDDERGFVAAIPRL